LKEPHECEIITGITKFTGQSSTMRILMAMLASMIVPGAMAQNHLAVSAYPNAPMQTPMTSWLAPSFYYSPGFVPFDQSARRWQILPHAGVSAGYVFVNGGVSWVSAPVGVTLVRPLNNNLAAFSNLSVAPTVFSMGSLNSVPATQSPYSGTRYGFSTHVEGGLLYTNDARTFSISGSVSVDRGSYPVFQPVAPPKSYRAN
jgi:hypothetical protein